MKGFHKALIVITLLSISVTSCVNLSQEAGLPVISPDGKAAAHSINAFALDLYRSLKEGQENLFFSPYSTSVALSMAFAGARGDTEAQMAKALHYKIGRKRLHSAVGNLDSVIRAASKDGRVTLNVANALWGQKGYGFRKDFFRLLQTEYRSSLREVDFRKSSNAAADEINRWAATETNGRIKDIVQRIPHNTKLILANAIHFKGMWAKQFKKSMTKDEDFTLPDGSKKSVPFMRQTAGFPYMEGDDFQALELPYKGKEFSMVVFLPRRHDGLKGFEKSLNLSSRFHKYGRGFSPSFVLQAAKRWQSVRALWAWIFERVFLRSSLEYFHLKGLAISVYRS